MSYDIGFHGYVVGNPPLKIELSSFNITYNAKQMLDEAFGTDHFKKWIDKPVNSFKDLIKKGIDDMIARPEYYSQFNAPNGWGTYPNILRTVQYIYAEILNMEEQGYDLNHIFLDVY